MNKDTASGNWKVFKGRIKEKWGNLTDDDFTVLEGDRDQLEGTIQKRYGVAREEAQRQVQEFRERNAELFREMTRRAS